MHLVRTSPEWVTRLNRKFEARPEFTRCSRCLYDEATPSISFDENGVCSYCHMMEGLEEQYPIGEAGWEKLTALAEQIKADGQNKQYDVVVGVSGGCDSSYMLHLCQELKLRPLAVHFDNTWNSQIATENIHCVLKKLDIDLFTYVVDNEEYNDIFAAFLRAGVPEIDGPTDIALTTTLYMAAAKHRIGYIFNGHSFRTEGVSPLGWCYTDGKYIDSVVRQFSDRQLKTYPNLWFSTFLRYMLINRVKRIRPLYYIDYHKEKTKKMLADTYGWQWYGGHHLENRMTHFNHAYVFPLRFHMDQRLNGYSALIRSGQMSREEGLELIKEPLKLDLELLEVVQKRLGFSDEEMERVMTQPLRTFKDFKTYKQRFERWRPFFYLMYKLDLVPKSFYLKYTSKSGI